MATLSAASSLATLLLLPAVAGSHPSSETSSETAARSVESVGASQLALELRQATCTDLGQEYQRSYLSLAADTVAARLEVVNDANMGVVLLVAPTGEAETGKELKGGDIISQYADSSGHFQDFEMSPTSICAALQGDLVTVKVDLPRLSRVSDMSAHYGRIFRIGNRNAASHLWSGFLLERAESLSVELYAELSNGYCPISGSPVTPRDGNRYLMRLPHADGSGDVAGFLHFCCTPCVCDTKDFLKVDTKTVATAAGPTELSFVVIGNPCTNPGALTEPFVQFDRQTSISESAAELRCDGETLIGAPLSDRGYIVIGMFHPVGRDVPRPSAAAAQRYQALDGVTYTDEVAFDETCAQRAREGYNSGMGSIFRKVAEIAPVVPAAAPVPTPTTTSTTTTTTTTATTTETMTTTTTTSSGTTAQVGTTVSPTDAPETATAQRGEASDVPGGATAASGDAEEPPVLGARGDAVETVRAVLVFTGVDVETVRSWERAVKRVIGRALGVREGSVRVSYATPTERRAGEGDGRRLEEEVHVLVEAEAASSAGLDELMESPARLREELAATARDLNLSVGEDLVVRLEALPAPQTEAVTPDTLGGHESNAAATVLLTVLAVAECVF